MKSINKRSLFLLTVALSFFYSILHAQTTPPNVIVYLLDDVGLTDVQAHSTYFPDGSPLYETPNILRLASEGMRFRHAYAHPLCSASRSALLSGQNSGTRVRLFQAIVKGSVPEPILKESGGAKIPFVYPNDRDHLPLEIETIAERLKQAGYATWHAGKWHLAKKDQEQFYPVEQGFDKQLGVGGSGPGGYFGPFKIPNLVDHLGNEAPGKVGDHLVDHMTKLVKEMIDDHLIKKPQQPFFLYYPAYSVHSPHQTKKSLFNYYQKKIEGLPDSKHKHPVLAGQMHEADRELGIMLDYLDEKGLTDNTLIIFTSDNGGLSFKENMPTKIYDDIGSDGITDNDPANQEDGTYKAENFKIKEALTNMAPRRGGKGSLFEGGVRIPMIVRYPNGKIPAGISSNEPVSLEDIYPTILDFTSVDPKSGYRLDGESLTGVLQDKSSLSERDLLIHFPRIKTTWDFEKKFRDQYEKSPFTYPGGTTLIKHPFKLIARYSTAHDAVTVDYQLFKLDDDEGEFNNVAGLNPMVVDSMRKRLQARYEDADALVPLPNPNYNGKSNDAPEISSEDYLVHAGLTSGTLKSSMDADPDGDGRTNQEEILQQTDPSKSDSSVNTIWLYDNGSFEELRFAIPAKMDQSTFHIVESKTSKAAFDISSDLELDAQYGPFYVYKMISPKAGLLPADYTVGFKN